MELLNEDMKSTLDALDIADSEKKILYDILRIEKINKEKEWGQDARKQLMDIIDNTGEDKE